MSILVQVVRIPDASLRGALQACSTRFTELHIWNPDRMYVPSTYRYVLGTCHVHRCYGTIPTCTALYRDVLGTYQHVLLPQSMYWYVPGTYHLPLVHTGTY